MDGGRIDRVRERLWLTAALLVRMVEEVTDFWVIFEHPLIKVTRDGDPVVFQDRCGRFDDFDGLLV